MASLKKRGPLYYIQYYLPGKKQRRVNLHTDSYQIAREKLRRFESAQACGDESPLPTRTPIADIVTVYVQHIRTIKTAKSAQTDIYYLREMFGSICEALKVTSRRLSPKARKRPPIPGMVQDRRCKAPVIEPDFFEQITTAMISGFISGRMRERRLAAKTANRYREIMMRLFNWSMDQCGIKVNGTVNPVLKVQRYREPAPQIRFLALPRIDQQLQALDEHPQLQAMVATYIFAGVRREELLWLTHDDIDWNAKPYGLIRVRAKTVGAEMWQPKTRVNRAVPISSRLRPYLDKQRLRSAKSQWLFPNTAGGRYDPDNFSSDLRMVNKKSGLEWACLDYRHTFGSQLAMKGESLYKIATIMGNSPEICRRHYAAVHVESLITSVEFTTHQADTEARIVGGISA
jgi:integrase